MIENTGPSMGWSCTVLYNCSWQKSYTNWRAYPVFCRDQRVTYSRHWLRPRQSWVVGKNSGHDGTDGIFDSEAEGDLCWNSKETNKARQIPKRNKTAFGCLGGLIFGCKKMWLLDGSGFRAIEIHCIQGSSDERFANPLPLRRWSTRKESHLLSNL